MSGPRATLWRLFPTVRNAERERFLFFFSLSALISCGQTLGLSGSEALYLVHIGPDRLPQAFTLASLVTVVGSLVYAYWVGQLRNDRIFVFMLAGSALALVGGASALGMDIPGLVTALFCAFYLLQAVFLNLHFWTFATDFFDTISSKRLFPLFALGASVGGVIGGSLAALLSSRFGAESLILAWAFPLLAAAVLIYRAHNNLLRWSPVGLLEADESSTEAMSGALRYLRRSSLARWSVVSVLGLVFSLFLLQFIYLDIFSKSFPDAGELAAFLGIYLAVSNAIEIAVAQGLTQWLIPRFGVARAGVIHPVLSLLCFGALALDARLHVAVLARANRELLENALAAPLRSLSYNALSFRFRGRMRAFLEGIVFNAGMAVAGVVLIVIGSAVELTTLCAIGAVSAFVYLLASLRVQREYLKSLVAELRTGRLDLRAVRSEMGAGELQGIADQWQVLAMDENERPTSVLLQLAPVFAENALTTHLEVATGSPHPRVRVACLEALAAQRAPISDDLLTASLRDDDTKVRLAALTAAGRVPSRSARLETAIHTSLADEDPAVRAEAALHCGSDGLSTLREMAAATDPQAACEALERLPIALVDSARERLQDENAGVRAAALRCWSRLLPAVPLAANQLVDELQHPDARVRCAAAQALGALGEDQNSLALANALDDRSRAVREEAGAALAGMGEPGLRATQALIGGLRVWTVDAALSTLAQMGTPPARAALEQAYRDHVTNAWECTLAFTALPSADDLESRFLRVALGNSISRSLWLAFRALELLEDPAVVRSVQAGLRQKGFRERADALEVLTCLADREASALLALLMETGPLEDKLPALKRAVSLPEGETQVIAEAAASKDRWLRMAAQRILSQAGVSSPEEEQLMEGLLALRKVPLFSHLTLDQLETISQLMHPAEYLAGEVMMRQGDPGEELYVLLEGEAKAYQNYGTDSETYLSTMRPVSYIGEIAILDQAARSATVVVTEDARLLTLGAQPFRELILQTPEISFEVFRVLTERIRRAESRGSAL